jgi:hypothetical protein
MKSFTYNDLIFSLEKSGNGWDITYKSNPAAAPAYVGAALFQGVPESDVEAKAKTLVKSIFPVGIKIVGPDVAHPTMIGDMKLVGPDTLHPNFIYWNKDSSSPPKNLG